jgi:hypothetical protein
MRNIILGNKQHIPAFAIKLQKLFPLISKQVKYVTMQVITLAAE